MKLKRILSIICMLVFLVQTIASAADYTALREKADALSVSLANGSDLKQILGEAAILIADYDVLNTLSQKGAVTQAASLKTTADTAFKTADKDSVENLIANLKQAVAVLSGNMAPTVFSDIKSGDWYYDAVIYAVSNGIFKGMSDSEFAPNMAITRGMFLTLMGRMYKKDTMKYSQGYSDIPADAYYAEAVNWAKAKGILDFITDSKFYPDKPITREELVTVLRGCMAEYGIDVDYMAQLKSFADSSAASEWAKDNISWASAKKIVSGFEDGTFRPQATATRAQVAQIFYNQR